jgi:signal transduction histidine kinase
MTALSKAILVVEDDADIREALLGLLRDEGYDASACSNGLEALEHLRSGQRADAILLDLMMPVMNGWQFRVQQKRDPRLATIPVLVISADTTAKAAAIDADAYLPKPLQAGALLGTIERALLASERRQLQASLVETERLASLGTLAAGVAHEINNPLAYVMANLGFVEQSLGPAGAPVYDAAALREALAETREGCERIRTIVRDLQLFSRTSENDESAVDVRRVLDSSVNIVMNEIRSRARVTREYGEVPLISANAARLGQVFLNLVLNAAQAIREGEPTKNEIRLVIRAEDDAVLVLVSDTGEGIPAEVRAKVFDPFFTTKPIGVGTGLGLSISHHIVTAMGGELTLESRRGPGTTFRVRLPVAEVKERDEAPRALAPTRLHRARLLVIDDEAFIGKMLERVLGDAYTVEATTSSDAALARIAAGERFDLILCDMMMPGQSGIDVHAAIERSAPEQAKRVVFLTGGTFNARADDFLARSGSMVISKPFSVDELRARLDEALARFGR